MMILPADPDPDPDPGSGPDPDPKQILIFGLLIKIWSNLPK